MQILDPVGQRVFISRRLLSVICCSHWIILGVTSDLKSRKIRRSKDKGGRSKGFKEQCDGDVSNAETNEPQEGRSISGIYILLRFAHGLRNNGKTPSS